MPGQQRIRRCPTTRRQCHACTKKSIHKRVNQLGPHPSRSRRRHGKITHQPNRFRRRCLGQPRHHPGQCLRRKTIEEKTGHNRVVTFPRLPLTNIGTHPINRARLLARPTPRHRQHAGTDFHTSQFRLRMSRQAGSGKTPMPLAHTQDAAATCKRVEPLRSNTLQPMASQHLFHPIVVRRQPVEIHDTRQYAADNSAPAPYATTAHASPVARAKRRGPTTSAATDHTAQCSSTSPAAGGVSDLRNPSRRCNPSSSGNAAGTSNRSLKWFRKNVPFHARGRHQRLTAYKKQEAKHNGSNA